MTRPAIVIGSAGQDGVLLSRALAGERRVVGYDAGDLDLLDAAAVAAAIAREHPAQLYYLAAAHHSSEERPDRAAELRRGFDVHVLGAYHALAAVEQHAPDCRVFYAGSSQMFGEPSAHPQDESTPLAPRTPYAITKVAGAHACHAFRARGVNVSVGFLYNHESPLRGPRFVSQRIVRGALAARATGAKLVLGDLAATCDWGYAPDFVEAMRRIVARDDPDDYVVATGEAHTVRDFAAVAFEHVGLDYRKHVEVDPSLVGASSSIVVGNSARLRARTGWRPTVSFEQMVRILVAAAESS